MKLERSGIIRSPDAKGRDVMFVHLYGSKVLPHRVFPLGIYNKTDGTKVYFEPEAMEEVCHILRQRIKRRKVTGKNAIGKNAIGKNAIGKNATFELIGDRGVVGVSTVELRLRRIGHQLSKVPQVPKRLGGFLLA